MVPSGPQTGAPSTCAAQIVRAGPPLISIFLSSPYPDEKNARKRLSGDQNGETAPSVPGTGSLVTESSERTQICVVPSRAATMARRRPSGEMARRVRLSAMPIVVPGGADTTKRVAGPRGLRGGKSAKDEAATIARTATAHAIASRAGILRL